MQNTGRKDRRKEEGDEKKQREKKPFDKKKYRLQKYSNKYKVNQWEERRKKAVLRGFYKELKRDQQNSTEWSDVSNTGETSDNSKRKGSFYKAKQENWRVKEDKKKRINEAICAKAKREEALKKYKEKKMRTFQVLSRKTKKGQPVMKGRIEMLLEKIQQNLT